MTGDILVAPQARQLLPGPLKVCGTQLEGSSQMDLRLSCTAAGGSSSTALQQDFFIIIWFDFFLPVKDCCKHWAFKLKGVNESVPVITITRSLVHSTVALRWFLVISKSIPKACSCCYSPPVHHRRCRFAAQHDRLNKKVDCIATALTWIFTLFLRHISWGLPGTLLNISLG